jgi:hypothetical protein
VVAVRGHDEVEGAEDDAEAGHQLAAAVDEGGRRLAGLHRDLVVGLAPVEAAALGLL